MKRSGDSTHHCQSTTPTLNDLDLPPPTLTQSSEQECSYLTASERHLSTYFVYGVDQFTDLSVLCQNPMSLDTHESVKPSGVLSTPKSLSNFSQSTLSSDLAAASESLLVHSSAQAFICAKSKHPA